MCGKRSCLGVDACNHVLLHELYKKFSPKVLVGVVAPSIDDTRVKYARLRLAFRESYTRLLDKRLRQQVRWRHSSAHRRAALQRMRVTYAGPKRVETFRLTATSSRWRQTSRRQVQVQVQVQVST